MHVGKRRVRDGGLAASARRSPRNPFPCRWKRRFCEGSRPHTRRASAWMGRTFETVCDVGDKWVYSVFGYRARPNSSRGKQLLFASARVRELVRGQSLSSSGILNLALFHV